jgi:peptide/nickel transport system permease protein
MKAYIIRRIQLMIPTLLLITVIAFMLVRLVPGTVVDIMAADLGTNSKVTKDEIARRLGLDQPVFIQYGRWLGVLRNSEGKFSGLIQGNFGDSLWQQRPVIALVKDRLPVTIELGLVGFFIAHLIAIPLGIFSALRRDTIGDYIARGVAILAIAVPVFWLATMCVVFPAIWWRKMPSIRWVSFFNNPLVNIRNILLPGLLMGISMSGMLTRLTRTRMIDVLGQDYIRTAWAKGLRERVVIVRHGLKNSLISVITMSGMQIATIFGGAVIIEKIFTIPGMGRMILDATTNRDYPILQGTLFFMAIMVMFTNLAVDILYGLIDPRVQISKGVEK